jgi:hypothetical protein
MKCNFNATTQEGDVRLDDQVEPNKDTREPLKLKGKFYRTAVQLAMLYEAEC